MSTTTLNPCDPTMMMAQMSTAMTTDLVSVCVTATVVAALLIVFKVRSRPQTQAA